MRTKKPIFSVVIPAYNEEKLLPNCLKSVLNQDFPKEYFEVIVVNNCSTDKTPQIAKKFKVKLVNEPRKGLLYARNAGLKKSRGKYIVNFDADSFAPKNWLRKIHFLFKKNREAVMVTGPCICVDQQSQHDYFDLFISLILHFHYQLFKNTFAYYGGNFAFKKSLFQKIGGYDLRFPTDQLSLVKRLKKAGGRVVFDKNLKVQSSPRRKEGRMLKFLFKEALLLYFINNLYIKITGKSLGDWEDVDRKND